MNGALAKAHAHHLQVVGQEKSTVRLSEKQLKKQQAIVIVMRYVRKLRAELKSGDSLNPATKAFTQHYHTGALPATVLHALNTLRPTKKGQCPNRATLYRWDQSYTDYLQGDQRAAAPKHKGRARTLYGWEARAIHFYQFPSNPDMAAVADWLREEGHTSATDSRVRAYLNSMPANLGANGRGRLGDSEYRKTQRAYVMRDTSNLPVGFIYQGDGHCVDVYVAHPFTGQTWRPELTIWIDVASRYIVGWYISEAESSQSTLFSLSNAMITHDHVPAMLHIDNGAGFRSKMMNSESTGFYESFDMQTMFSIPGNPGGKGQVERWFKTMEGQFGKKWATFCGHEMVDEVKSKIAVDVKAGKYTLPSLRDYSAALDNYIQRYNHKPHRSLEGRTPAELWATLARTPLHTPEAAVVLPRKTRSVRRCAINLDKRWYRSPELEAYNGDKVIVEYDLRNDSMIRILRHDDKRWICDAALVEKAEYLPESRVEEAQQKRLVGQKKRLQRKLDEVEARAGLAITHTHILDDLELANEGAQKALQQKERNTLDVNATPGAATPGTASPSTIEIDITSTDY